MKEINHHAVLYFGSDSNSSRFTNEQNQVIKTQLIHLKASFSKDARLLSPDHSLGFTTHVINQIVENRESLKTGQDAFEQVDVWNTRLEQEILTIFALPLTMEAAIKKVGHPSRWFLAASALVVSLPNSSSWLCSFVSALRLLNPPSYAGYLLPR